MRLWERIKKKSTYISVLIIVFANLLFLTTVQGWLFRFTGIAGPEWLVGFIGMFIITLIFFLVSVEVFEV